MSIGRAILITVGAWFRSPRKRPLTPTEYDLIRGLVANAGKVLTYHQLLREVWGVGYEQETHMLRVNISNLPQNRNRTDPSAVHSHRTWGRLSIAE